MANGSELLAEQLRHTLDLLKASVERVEAAAEHDRQLTDHRLAALETMSKDHEVRLRQVSDGVTQFKVWSGLTSGGSGLMSLVALIRAWLGG